ncbi:MAG: restriction endonuclease subunit S [Candidatus Cloacimonadaceae bacterium]|nr:restriction endonuclease subunit S [Candidatus Cloacimonadaceae bacterium]
MGIETTVGTFCPFIYGKGLPAGSRNSFGTIPVYGSNGIVGWHDVPYTKGPTVVIGRKGTVGAVHYSPIPCWPIDTTFFIEYSDPQDARFTYYLLKTLGLELMNSDSAVPGLNRDAAHLRKIPLFDKTYRHAISQILGVLDEKIEVNRQICKTLEGTAQAIFKSWFVDFDPVLAKAAGKQPEGMNPEIAALFPDSFEDSETGPIPKWWKFSPCLKHLSIISGGTPKTTRHELWDGNIPWYSIGDAPPEHGVFVLKTEKSISQAGLESSSTRLLPVGTTIISARGTVGKLALTGVPMTMNQSCYGLVSISETPFWSYLTIADAVDTLKQRTHGSVFDTITRETFNNLSVIDPGNCLKQVFEGIVSPLMMAICNNVAMSHSLVSIRDFLLPKLISGKIRINDAES